MSAHDPSLGSTTFSVTLRATRHGLGRLVSVLQARGAEIHQLTWTLSPQQHSDRRARVTVVVELDGHRHAHLRKTLARLVDVLDIDEQPTLPAAP